IPLMDQLRSPHADVRAQAARALGERKAPIAVEALVLLLSDAEPAVRLEVITALGRLGSAGSVPALLSHLAQEDRFLAFATRQAFRRIGAWDAVAKGLTSEDPKVRLGVLLTCEGIYHRGAVQMLLAEIEDTNRRSDERA